MALTKVNRGGLNTGVSDSSNATFLTATSAEGVTLAGTLAVTGVHTVGTNAVATSEGGAVTTSVVQGLAKCWAEVNMPGTPAILDSFNYSSIRDDAQGRTTMFINNDMNNALYSKPGSESDGAAVHCFTQSPAVGSYQVNMYNGSAYVDKDFSTSVLGDLA